MMKLHGDSGHEWAHVVWVKAHLLWKLEGHKMDLALIMCQEKSDLLLSRICRLLSLWTKSVRSVYLKDISSFFFFPFFFFVHTCPSTFHSSSHLGSNHCHNKKLFPITKMFFWMLIPPIVGKSSLTSIFVYLCNRWRFLFFTFLIIIPLLLIATFFL